MTPVRIGIIGCGIVAHYRVNGLQALKDKVQVVACADVDRARAEKLAAELGASHAFDDYRDLLALDEVQGVDVCLPHHLHLPVTVNAARAKKHVLCEKPIATSLEEADAMIAAAKDNGVTLMVAENYRFFPQVQTAKRLIDEGVIGQPIFLRTFHGGFLGGAYMDTLWRFNAQSVGGGTLIDSGIHYVDMLLYLGGDVESVQAYTATVRKEIFTAEDLAIATCQFRSGALGSIGSSWSVRPAGEEPLFTIFGTEGSMVAHADLTVFSDKLPDKKRVYPSERPGVYGATFGYEIEHFADCIATGQPTLMPGEEGRRDLAFVLAAYESVRTGQRTTISQ